MKDPTHSLFIDESGTKEYADETCGYGEGRSRYFVFGGVLLSNPAASKLTASIIEAKKEFFNTEDVEIKSTWLRNPGKRRNQYLDKFGIEETRLTEFTNRYYEILNQSEMVLIASVVDKLQVQEQYKYPHYVPSIAYEIILQRLAHSVPGTATVIIDDMTGSTPKMTQYKENLKRQHRSLRQNGSRLLSGFRFNCLLPEVRFTDSAKHHLVQVADIAAYNVYRQFRDYGEEWETKGLKKLPVYEHFGRLVSKFRQGPNGRIQGYGVVKFPLRTQVRWAVAPK